MVLECLPKRNTRCKTHNHYWSHDLAVLFFGCQCYCFQNCVFSSNLATFSEKELSLCAQKEAVQALLRADKLWQMIAERACLCLPESAQKLDPPHFNSTANEQMQESLPCLASTFGPGVCIYNTSFSCKGWAVQDLASAALRETVVIKTKPLKIGPFSAPFSVSENL